MSKVRSFISTSNSLFQRVTPGGFHLWAAVALVVVLCHVFWSCVVLSYLSHQHQHRVVNVKNWEKGIDEWEVVMGSFARQALAEARRNNRQTIFFLGSSVTYGFPYAADLGFTHRVSQRFSGYRVANLAAVGVGMQAITDFVTCSLRDPHRPDVLIAEIPLVNSISSIQSNLQPPNRQCRQLSTIDEGLWGLVWRRPIGTGWVALLWEEIVEPDHGKKIKINPLPAEFFASRERFSQIESQYKFVLNQYLADLSSMGKKVFVFVSPIYTPGIEVAGGDRASVERQIAISYEVCRSHREIICIDSRVFNEDIDLFANMTHFNVNGNKEFGNWLASELAEKL